MTCLLDINVLVALFDPHHLHHEAAHRWYASRRRQSWATCPLTENGFIRVVANPSYPKLDIGVAEAATRLRMFCEAPAHEFWPDDVSLLGVNGVDLSKLQGHQQLTDLYLLLLAQQHGGVLATFDTRLPLSGLVVSGSSPVELISP